MGIVRQRHLNDQRLEESTSHYARRYMSNGMIHVQLSFHEFARDVNTGQKKVGIMTFSILFQAY